VNINLLELKIGKEETVKFIDGEKEFRLKLEGLGIVEGIKVRILMKNTCFDSFLISVNGEKIGLGEDILKNIYI